MAFGFRSRQALKIFLFEILCATSVFSDYWAVNSGREKLTAETQRPRRPRRENRI